MLVVTPVVPFLSLLLVVALSLLVTRVATVVLVHTGLGREAARFQARSAFTGVGFTTGEAEAVVRHPVRRRVVTTLMLLGNAGLATAVASLILGFAGEANAGLQAARIGGVLVAVALLLWGSTHPWVDRKLSTAVSWALSRWTRIDVRDYGALLELAGPYRVVELEVQSGDWLADRALETLDLRSEGIVVMGIRRPSGRYLGAPTGETELRQGDLAILYGRVEALEALDERRRDWRGDREHDEAVAAERRARSEQRSEDEAKADEEREIAERRARDAEGRDGAGEARPHEGADREGDASREEDGGRPERRRGGAKRWADRAR